MFIIPSCGFYFTFEQPLKTETTDRFKLLTGPNSRNASASKTTECRMQIPFFSNCDDY